MDTSCVSEERSKLMSKIRSANTKPEIMIRKYLFSKGFRYRINVPTLPGKPDIVLKKWKAIIFINGCFWHGHENCKIAHIPKTNEGFWSSKIKRNTERDKCNIESLKKDNWNVIVVWECELGNRALQEERFTRLISQITT